MTPTRQNPSQKPSTPRKPPQTNRNQFSNFLHYSSNPVIQISAIGATPLVIRQKVQIFETPVSLKYFKTQIKVTQMQMVVRVHSDLDSGSGDFSRGKSTEK